MLPTMIISLITIEVMPTKKYKKYYSLTLVLQIIYFIVLFLYCLVQTFIVFYGCFIPMNNLFLVTTSIENKTQMSARFYQALHTVKKISFAMMIVYGRNSDQSTVIFLLLMCQITWLTYITMHSPLKYRFANFAC